MTLVDLMNNELPWLLNYLVFIILIKNIGEFSRSNCYFLGIKRIFFHNSLFESVNKKNVDRFRENIEERCSLTTSVLYTYKEAPEEIL